jgi:pyruvate/2-oxoglutarate dehydrogenase complex dihydrolipoamide acyltransferase (E2) component
MNEKTMKIEMPDLGEVTEAVVVEWLVDIGSAVCEGDDLLEVETAKTTFVVPAPATGVLQSMTAPIGTKVSRGAELGHLDLG